MANCLGYEVVRVGPTSVGPTSSIVSGGARSAIFHLDPTAPNMVRWRPDGALSSTNHAAPTPTSGGPLYPGGQIVVVGDGNIRNSRFISTTGQWCNLHCYYFDQVDVVQVDFTGAGVPSPSTASLLTDLKETQEELLLEIKRIRLGTSLISDTDLVLEYQDS